MNKIAYGILAVSLLVGVSPFLVDEALVDKSSVELNASVVSVPPNDNFSVTEVGVNADPTMDYGRIPAGAKVTKYLNLSSSGKAAVEVSATGNISEKLEYPKYTIFEDNHTLPVSYRANETGYLSGEITVKTRGTNSNLGERWLEYRKYLIF